MYVYKDGCLQIASDSTQSVSVNCTDIENLVRRHGNPTYIYDLDDVESRFRALHQAFGGAADDIHYAMKANSHPRLLRHFADLGAGVDTVSGGEIALALKAGVPAERVIFSGVAKSKVEIRQALKAGIKQINVESPQELRRISEIAAELGCRAHVAFRFNPDVSPKTHPYITTGLRENKFGMDDSFTPELISILLENRHALQWHGLTMHIGSLLFDLAVIQEAVFKTIDVLKIFAKAGFAPDRLDIGGGLGIRYETGDATEEFSLIKGYGELAALTRATLARDFAAPIRLMTEPGRILVGRCGLLVGEVEYIKTSNQKNFAILNTGMNHLLRPALYGAKHRILAVRQRERTATYDVVGPICESSDIFAKNVELTELVAGDLVGIADAGAYGFAMASTYNAHALPREVVILRGQEL